MKDITAKLGILTVIFSLITASYGWINSLKLNGLKEKQEKRDSINFVNECKFKVFDYVSKSFDKDEKTQKATIILVQNIIEDSIFKSNLIKSILGNINNETLKNEIEKTLVATDYEEKAFRFLLKKNIISAKENFKKSYDQFPTLHYVDEINKLLKVYNYENLTTNENWIKLYKQIYSEFRWGMSTEIKNEFIIKTQTQ